MYRIWVFWRVSAASEIDGTEESSIEPVFSVAEPVRIFPGEVTSLCRFKIHGKNHGSLQEFSNSSFIGTGTIIPYTDMRLILIYASNAAGIRLESAY